MKVRVGAVDRWASGYHVSFVSPFGSGHAFWSGDVPVLGREYCVEIGCADRFVWGENICPVKCKRYAIRQQNGCLRLAGLLESIDGDGTAAIRLLDDLIYIRVKGMTARPGAWVELRVSDVTLHDAQV